MIIDAVSYLTYCLIFINFVTKLLVMMTGDMRQQLHHFIDVADDRNIEAIYTILEGRLNETQKFSAEDLEKFYERRRLYIEGKTENYTVKEAHALIRASRKQNEV